LAIFAAIRRASSLMSNFAADLRPENFGTDRASKRSIIAIPIGIRICRQRATRAGIGSDQDSELSCYFPLQQDPEPSKVSS
jgi:hypothetical protein